MDSVSSDLSAPALLVAMPQVLDPFFHRSVVLLIHHDEDGGFGFVVNRSTAVSLADVLASMQIPWTGAAGDTTFFGGPVEPQIGSVLYASASASATSALIAPGLVFSQDLGDLTRLAATPPPHLRFLLGHAGWGEGQLIDEILRNDWLVQPVDLDIVFDPNPEGTWERCLRRAGLDPATLPSWTEPVDEEVAN